MKCRDEVRRIAESVGATVDFYDHQLIVDAPRGYVWMSDYTTALCEPCENFGGQTWNIEACREIIARMQHGLEKCDEEMAREIEYEIDDVWRAADDAPEHIMVS